MPPKRRVGILRRPAARPAPRKKPSDHGKLPEAAEKEEEKKMKVLEMKPKDLLQMGPICIEDCCFGWKGGELQE